jgi:fructose-bisphosphate aldolase class I
MAAHLCSGANLEARRSWLSDEAKAKLEAVVEHIAQPGKGISACDESGRTINPRFEKVGMKPTEDLRRAYRQMLFEAEGASDYVSGVILDPETVFQKSSTGVPLPKVCADRGMLPGVKPSLTAYKLPGCDGETVMQGLDNLAERLREYKAAGCVFAKWRSPLDIDIAAGKPSQLAIECNMRDQARYALICQSEGFVPIVEPDLVLKGTHTLEDAVEINVRVNNLLFQAMAEHGVHLDGAILKVNMVNAGKDCSQAYSFEQIADANLRTLRRALPVSVRSVNYLSGGQTLRDAAARLDAINRLKAKRGGDRYAPWNLSYSWSAAVQLPLFELCRDAALERDAASGLPLAAMAAAYVTNLKIASAAAKGELQQEATPSKVEAAYPAYDAAQKAAATASAGQNSASTAAVA